MNIGPHSLVDYWGRLNVKLNRLIGGDRVDLMDKTDLYAQSSVCVGMDDWD